MEETLDLKILKENRGLTIFLIILMLLLVLLEGVNYYYKYLRRNAEIEIEDISNKNQQALLNFDEAIEYGTELTYNEMINKLIDVNNLIENTDIKIFINDEELTENAIYRFENIGNNNIKVLLSNTYNYEIITNKSKTIESIKDLEIKVEDTKLPIISGVKDKEITVGDTINLLEGITAKDEVDGELEISMEGNFDNQKTGEYVIKVSAKDKNDNASEQEFKVTVKEKPIVVAKPKSTKNTETVSSSNSNSTTSTSNDTSTKNGRLKLATDEAKRVVASIITPGMSDYQKAEEICKYLFFNVETQYNQSNEAYKTNYGNEAYAALIMKQAACSGFCKAVTLMCNAAGLQSKHINANKWTHQWNTVLVDGEWIIVDAQGGIFGGTVHPLEY